MTEGADGGDEFTVRVEAAPGRTLDAAAVDRLGARIREAVKVRAGVAVVEAGTIPEDARALVDRRG